MMKGYFSIGRKQLEIQVDHVRNWGFDSYQAVSLMGLTPGQFGEITTVLTIRRRTVLLQSNGGSVPQFNQPFRCEIQLIGILWKDDLQSESADMKWSLLG